MLLILVFSYKPVGTFSGVNEDSRDCYETLKVNSLSVNPGAA
jgi:hypothetical protein